MNQNIFIKIYPNCKKLLWIIWHPQGQPQTGILKISTCVDFLCIRKRRGKCGWIQMKVFLQCNSECAPISQAQVFSQLANNSLLQCAFFTYLGSILATDLPKLQLQTENSLKSLLGKKCFFLPPKQYAHPKQMFSHMIAHQNCHGPFQSETIILCRTRAPFKQVTFISSQWAGTLDQYDSISLTLSSWIFFGNDWSANNVTDDNNANDNNDDDDDDEAMVSFQEAARLPQCVGS